MSDLLSELEREFRNVFGDEHLVLRPEMTAADIDGWDSLAHINLIIAIEKSFRVRFATAEISRLKENGQNVGSLMDLLARKQGRV